MPLMRAPYTGVVFDVEPGSVGRRLERGFELLEEFELPEPGEPAPVEEPGSDADEEAAAEAKPTADSTIAEIRAWAKANGVELPKRGNKAALLAAIG